MGKKDEIVVVAAYRTPFGKATRGSFKATHADYLLSKLIQKGMIKCGVRPEYIEEIVLGNVLTPLGGIVEARIASLNAGIPQQTPISVINRLCASGLESIKIIADKIKNKEIMCGLAGGFETMSHNSFTQKYSVSDQSDFVQDAKNCLIPMGETSEIVAEKLSISREDADVYAFHSHKKAFDAQTNNRFKYEIVPITNSEGEVIYKDDGIREPNLQKMQSLNPCFKKSGVTTPANASQLSDGCAVVFLANRQFALEKNLPIIAKYIDCVSIGCAPELMGLGPVYAIKKLLRKHSLGIEDIEYFEINEAFASQVIGCIEELGISYDKANINGGSIAMGHPLGSTGARLAGTLLWNLSPQKYGVVSLCTATGMGTAALFLKE
ncbi:acetyl-CoA C-acetyltransferase [Edhazardia aedis USNM 41457]|uniref:acetyl-CoA C-acyltransferase n=1 Tax=Edhazardia aedis (strain USNM 41457) TaxID=1003232 RepID=J9D0Y9_EDHAE|nr:acetyl-CoA C-acetyltransferase [Edhazardia aedis USNM 41457]|eukprot:EJW01526.1 acetyl-CoA C-acetyltransferase [Edhazardia aedis USNM 41457]